MLGATGTIGRATVRALVRRGHEVVCFVRPRAGVGGVLVQDDSQRLFAGASVRFGKVTDPASLARDGLRGEHFDALVSCLASRTGAPKDAWAIDHQAHVQALDAARGAGSGFSSSDAFGDIFGEMFGDIFGGGRRGGRDNRWPGVDRDR